MYSLILTLIMLPGGCIDAMPCLTGAHDGKVPNEGGIVIHGPKPTPAPAKKANPTIIFPCPNAPPGYQCG